MYCGSRARPRWARLRKNYRGQAYCRPGRGCICGQHRQLLGLANRLGVTGLVDCQTPDMLEREQDAVLRTELVQCPREISCRNVESGRRILCLVGLRQHRPRRQISHDRKRQGGANR